MTYSAELNQGDLLTPSNAIKFHSATLKEQQCKKEQLPLTDSLTCLKNQKEFQDSAPSKDQVSNFSSMSGAQIGQSSFSSCYLTEKESEFASHSVTLHIKDAKTYRDALLNAYRSTNKAYEQLFSCVKAEGLYQRADPLRHPLIFYLGHTAVFCMNKLIVGGCLSFKERIDSKIESLMAIGVDEMSWDDLLPDTFDWPPLKDVQAYRKKVHDRVCQYISEELPLQDNSIVAWNSPLYILHMVIEHERIHLETSAVLIRQLPLHFIHIDPKNPFQNAVCPAMEFDFGKAMARLNSKRTMIPMAAKGKHLVFGRDAKLKESEIFKNTSKTDISRPPFPQSQYDSYGWDNEFGHGSFTFSHDFSISNMLVSNGDFLAFILAGGYKEGKYWSEEGRQWLAHTKVTHPRFWRPSTNNTNSHSLKDASSAYKLRILTSEIQMPWDWPVECNYWEALAFSRFQSEKLGKTLVIPSEEELLYMSYQTDLFEQGSKDQMVKDKNLVPLPSGNLGLRHSSACPVDNYSTTLKQAQEDSQRKSQSDSFIYDVTGNVWQHSRTTMYPFTNFKTHPIYDDFTVPTFDDRHNLLFGASWMSTGNEANPLSRYAFRRHFYQFSGFRLVEYSGEATTQLASNMVTLSNSKVSTGPLSDSTIASDAGASLSKASVLSVDFEARNHSATDASASGTAMDSNIYETDMLVNQYIHFHFGQLPSVPLFDAVLNFPALCADIGLALLQKRAALAGDHACTWRILDMGAAVCRSTFELAKHVRVEKAVGVDFSARFIAVAERFKEMRRLCYQTVEEGDLKQFRTVTLGAGNTATEDSASVSDAVMTNVRLDGQECDAWLRSNLGLHLTPFLETDMDLILSKCRFLQGDACNLSETHHLLAPTSHQYDLILAANLIDRVYEPNAVLEGLTKRLKPGGILLLTSPYTWLPEFTNRDAWIGARKVNGENVTTLDALNQYFSEKGTFEPINLSDYFQVGSTPRTNNSGKRVAKRPRKAASHVKEMLKLEGSSKNAFSIPFVIKETARKFQFTFAQVSVWRKL